ncbi:uncharacterized protein MONBRDRAFT_21902 [Monosiga brevicollis MX1]|uniref:Protein kinase domain-containing protein n=1 Tax=Monosiga brevicollis TaxID=81824 RepID=A9UNY5_MONBE|nr:uncharacterized protein MONBRDRAFT_21902 [Monosiga brevicollis MX1]EDQ92781.1 predicted protein [Monosiga brevicollis MX1]|eukprot:XP_001742543.1 hypothetical protein [Monosiga brevicollis MX1]
MTAGLQGLYASISDRRKPDKTALVPTFMTDADGSFVARHPVPLFQGRYAFTRVLAKGGFATLVEVEDTFQSGIRRAIKVMHASYAEMGVQEYDIISRLNAADPAGSYAIGRCFGRFWAGQHLCVAFELLSSAPLHHCIDRASQTISARRESPVALRLKAVAKVAVQVLHALELLEILNILHADIKPDNILLCDDSAQRCAVKLMDFGNSFEATPEMVGMYVEQMHDLQSLQYRAPEVLFNTQFGLPADVWSLGCILAEVSCEGSPSSERWQGS